MAAPVTDTVAPAIPQAPQVALPAASTPAPAPQLGSTLGSYFASLDPILRPVGDAFRTLSDVRKSLDLPNPVVQTSNFMFEGARADLTKALNMNPIFQVTHAFTLGPDGKNAYNFGAVLGDETKFWQAGLDDMANVTMRLNQRWTPSQISKIQAQLAPSGGQSFVQLEHDYQGRDFSANIKALNPSPINLTGIYVGNYLQSLTRTFALGAEAVYQRPSPEIEEAAIGYVAKLVGDKNDWIATAQWQPQGVAQLTYWQKLSEQVDVAGDLQVISVPQRRDAQASFAARYAFRMATLRAQIDSLGKLTSVYEARLSPAFAFSFAGEIDHLQGNSKFGVGVSIESASETIDPLSPPAPPPSVPL